jgi:hypothetical protein
LMVKVLIEIFGSTTGRGILFALCPAAVVLLQIIFPSEFITGLLVGFDDAFAIELKPLIIKNDAVKIAPIFLVEFM